MEAHITINAILLIISALITLAASLIVWQRSVPGSLTLGLLLFSMTIWSGFYAFDWLPIPPSLKILMPNFVYIGVVTVPSFFLIFALSFTNHGEWSNRHLLVLLAIEPAATLILAWTNNYHHLIFRSISLATQNTITRLQFEQGFWYSVNLVYSYLVILAGFIVLMYGMLRSSPLLKKQYHIVLTASFLPWGLNILSEYVVQSRNPFDLTPLVFGLSGVLFTYSMLRGRFMNIIPVARSRIIESMSDGVLVLDTQNRIIDINPAMEVFLGHKPASLLGRSASEALQVWIDQSDAIMSEQETRTELRIPNTSSRYLDLRVTPIFDDYQQLNGRLMVFRDVTDRKQVEKQLRWANERLQSQLIEIGTLQSKLRSQAIKDPLTDLFNRRYLDETFDREVARATREGYPVCVIMLDIDHFKKVNDTYGHEAGDSVLKALSRILSSRNRRGDFVCRFGGEEFVIVMPNMEMDAAYKRAEELRITLNALNIPYGHFNLTITISMGIASYPANGDDRESVLRAADRAMYAAKRAGRDHILTYDLLQSDRETLTD
jgi:diguanylate cyclase (GGDEF)-like protein/PAS domain S-box-containing protein